MIKNKNIILFIIEISSDINSEEKRKFKEFIKSILTMLIHNGTKKARKKAVGKIFLVF